jgi:hypothetical protein
LCVGHVVAAAVLRLNLGKSVADRCWQITPNYRLEARKANIISPVGQNRG